MFDYHNLSRLDDILATCVQNGTSPGMCVALVTPDEKWLRCYGHKPIVPETEQANFGYRMGSCKLQQVCRHRYLYHEITGRRTTDTGYANCRYFR